MIAIGNVLFSSEIFEEQFVCDLQKCKGGCCVDGDCGAPLNSAEVPILSEILPKVLPYIPLQFQKEIEQQGTYVMDDEHGTVTPVVNDGICVYGYYDEQNIVKCGIEKAWLNGEINFRKPISCHLYPIRIKEVNGYTLVNYEPRKKLCQCGMKLGKKLKVPVYVFLKDSLIAYFGESFYKELCEVGEAYLSQKSSFN